MRQDFLICTKDFFIDYDGHKIMQPISLNKALQQLSLQYGSSLQGRKEALSYILKTNRKVPLVISDSFRIYWLITRQINHADCTLINYSKLLHVQAKGMNSMLVFEGGIKITIDEDRRIIKRQCALMRRYLIYRSSLLRESV